MIEYGSQGTVVIVNRGEIATRLSDWLDTVPQHIHKIKPMGGQIARQRNEGANRMRGEWVAFVDSDTVPLMHTIPQLLSHNLPIVGAIYVQRYAPFFTATVQAYEPAQMWKLEDLPRRGLLPVPATGTGCLLVRREVLEKVPYPWFKIGQLEPDILNEDVSFCMQAAEYGFPTHLDCDMRVGHVLGGNVILWPGRDARVWLQIEGPTDFRIPIL